MQAEEILEKARQGDEAAKKELEEYYSGTLCKYLEEYPDREQICRSFFDDLYAHPEEMKDAHAAETFLAKKVVEMRKSAPKQAADPKLPELIRKTREGDMDAALELVGKYEGRMQEAAMEILHDEAKAGEAVQKARTSMFMNLSSLEEESGFEKWLDALVEKAAQEVAESSAQEKEDQLPEQQEDLSELSLTELIWMAKNGKAAAKRRILAVHRAKMLFLAQAYDPHGVEKRVSRCLDEVLKEEDLDKKNFEQRIFRKIGEESLQSILQGRSGKELLEESPVDPSDREYEDTEEIPDPGQERKIRMLDAQQAVVTAMDGLDPAGKAVVLMRYYEGLSTEEIAKILQAEESLVLSVLRASKRKIQRSIEQQHVTENLPIGGSYPFNYFLNSLHKIRNETPDDPVKEEEAGFPSIRYHQRLKWAVVLLAVLLAAAWIWASWSRKDRQEREKAREEALMRLRIHFAEEEATGEEKTTFEYGNSSASVEDLVTSHTGSLEIRGAQVIDFSEVGTTEVVYALSTTDRYGETVAWDVVRHYTVEDTEPPVIRIRDKQVTLNRNSEFSVDSYILSVRDPVDGDLEKVESAPAESADEKGDSSAYARGWYTVEGSVDVTKLGDYKIRVTASDKNGLTAVEEFTVTITMPIVENPNAHLNRLMLSNYQTLYAYLTGELGYNDAAAAGILGNIYMESRYQSDDMSSDGYYGICQWGGGRLRELIFWCMSNGYSYASLEGQMRFMAHELEDYPELVSSLQSLPDTIEAAYDAGELFRSVYERGVMGNVGAISAGLYQTIKGE